MPKQTLNLSCFAMLCVVFLMSSCNGDLRDPSEPLKQTEPPIDVQIFEPGDTSLGAAYAYKLGSAWAASVYCAHSYNDKDKLNIIFYTFTTEGYERESVEFYYALLNTGKYNLTTTITNIDELLPGEILASYGRWLSDGDLLEDVYGIDSTDIKNRLVITKLDLPNKRIEGTFHAAFQNIGPNFAANNPLKVTFSSGRFWATVRD